MVKDIFKDFEGFICKIIFYLISENILIEWIIDLLWKYFKILINCNVFVDFWENDYI